MSAQGGHRTRVSAGAPAAETGVALVCAAASHAAADSVEAMLREAPGFDFGRFGYHSVAGISAADARADFEPHVVMVTLDTVPETELDTVFAWLRRSFKDRPVVAIPAEPATADVLMILEHGAADFLLPPLRLSELLPRLRQQAIVTQRGDLETRRLKDAIGLSQIIGESPAFLKELQRLPRFAQCDATVLISGESGTGKEIFARALHYLSPRAALPFVPINCGALSESLMESEIFGHKRGAFTGAVAERGGLIRAAEGGTLFLDEVDALSCSAQAKLLRFLQEGEYRAVGSEQLVHANVRVLAAANADFGCIVREGKFREDLFYRLNVLQLALPPLRERRGDLPALARHFLGHQPAAGAAKTLSLDALQRMLDYAWPGNVRELQNVLTRAALLCDRAVISADDLDLPDAGVAPRNDSFRELKEQAVTRFEREYLRNLLATHGGNVTHAARAAHKNRRAFWQLLRKHKFR